MKRELLSSIVGLTGMTFMILGVISLLILDWCCSETRMSPIREYPKEVIVLAAAVIGGAFMMALSEEQA